MINPCKTSCVGLFASLLPSDILAFLLSVYSVTGNIFTWWWRRRRRRVCVESHHFDRKCAFLFMFQSSKVSHMSWKPAQLPLCLFTIKRLRAGMGRDNDHPERQSYDYASLSAQWLQLIYSSKNKKMQVGQILSLHCSNSVICSKMTQPLIGTSEKSLISKMAF